MWEGIIIVLPSLIFCLRMWFKAFTEKWRVVLSTLLSRLLLIIARDQRESCSCGKEFKDTSLGADIYSV